MFTVLRGGYYDSTKYNTLNRERLVECYELELCTTSNSESVFDGKHIKRHKNSAIFAKPGIKRKSLSNFKCYYIHFICNDSSFADEYLNKLPIQCFPNNYMEMINAIIEVMSYVSCMTKDISLKKTQTKLIDSILVKTVIKMYIGSINYKSKGNERYSENIASAVQYIEKNYFENIKIIDIANAAMLSQSFTYTQFKKFLGISPHEYLVNVRLNSACNMLIFTDKSVGEISLECGFSNVNYLNSIFPKYYNTTPLKYRMRYRNI